MRNIIIGLIVQPNNRIWNRSLTKRDSTYSFGIFYVKHCHNHITSPCTPYLSSNESWLTADTLVQGVLYATRFVTMFQRYVGLRKDVVVRCIVLALHGLSKAYV